MLCEPVTAKSVGGDVGAEKFGSIESVCFVLFYRSLAVYLEIRYTPFNKAHLHHTHLETHLLVFVNRESYVSNVFSILFAEIGTLSTAARILQAPLSCTQSHSHSGNLYLSLDTRLDSINVVAAEESIS